MTRKFDRYSVNPMKPPDGSNGAGYIASGRIAAAVNAALWTGQPLLITGEAGVGKTHLADSIAWQLDLGKPIPFPVRSDSVGRDAVYVYDHLHRMYDAIQRREASVTLPPLATYVRPRALATAFAAAKNERQCVVLVDEVDKAPRDFPNDLLHLLSEWRYVVDETGEEVSIADLSLDHRPLVLFTSNEQNPLPEPFLRRCVYLRIEFPDPILLLDIVRSRTKARVDPRNPDTDRGRGEPSIAALADEIRTDDADDPLRVYAVQAFLRLRGDRTKWRKAPTTAEMLGWLAVLMGRPDVEVERVRDLAESLVGAIASLDPKTLTLFQTLDPQLLVKTRDDALRLGLQR